MTDLEYEASLWDKVGIYMWTSPSNKKYVGYSDNLGSRHKDFRCASKNRTYTGTNSYIDRARAKYAYREWKYEILEYCSTDELGEREQYWIDFYHTTDRRYGYNITKGGKGGNGVPKTAFKKGHTSSPEQQAKRMTTLHKHIEEGSVSYEWNATKVALYNDDGSLFKVFNKTKECWEFLGRTSNSGISKYHIDGKYRMREIEGEAPLFIEPFVKEKRHHTAETRKKISEKATGKQVPSRWKPVIATNKSTGEVLNFLSIDKAGEKIYELELAVSADTAAKNISEAIVGRRKSAYGFVWKRA